MGRPKGSKNKKPLKPKPIKGPPGRPEIWTEEKALELGQGLVDWMMEDESRVYWMEYIVINRGLYKQIVSDLSSKFATFSALAKKAKDIQELRLLKTVGKGEIKSMFVLKNHHGYADKQEVKTSNVNYNYDLSDLKEKTEDELKEVLLNLTRKGSKNKG